MTTDETWQATLDAAAPADRAGLMQIFAEKHVTSHPAGDKTGWTPKGKRDADDLLFHDGRRHY